MHPELMNQLASQHADELRLQPRPGRPHVSRPGLRNSVRHRAGQMVCAVTDPGPQPPVLVSAAPLAEAGRGLQVVLALSVTWGWTRLGGRRKVVWAALRLPR